MNNLTLALLLSGTNAIFTDAQKATFCVASKLFATKPSRNTCLPDTALGQAEAGGTVVNVGDDAARSYTTACARRCANDIACLGFQATEPADDGTGGACTTYAQSPQKWSTDATGTCVIATAAAADDTGNSPQYPTTNVHKGYTDKDYAACKALCVAAGNTNCRGIQSEGNVCKLIRKTGDMTGTGTGNAKCVDRVSATAGPLPSAVADGTDKTMCWSKKTPGAAAVVEVETGYAKAFATAAKAAVAAATNDSTNTVWYDAIEASRSADQETVAKVTGITDPEKQNFDDEFIMAWAMLLSDTFDPDSEAQKKFQKDVLLTTDSNPLGSEFGTIYKALTTDDEKKKAEKALQSLCQTAKENMYIPKTQALLKAMIKGKYYKKGLGDFTTTCVNAKAIKKLGYALMPFNTLNTDAQKDLDKLQNAYIKNQGKAGLHEADKTKGPFSILEYIGKRHEKIAGDAVTKAVRKVITDAIAALPTITVTVAANLDTVGEKVKAELKPWDKYATPTAGFTGFPCPQSGEGDTAARPKDNCKDVLDANEKVSKKACCSAVVPYKDLSTVEDKAAEFKNTVTGHMEVCVVSKDDKVATTWEPVQFVEILAEKYNVQCIEGAMKAAAGAAAVVGSIFMMQ